MVPLLMEGEGLQKGKIWISSEFKYFCKEIEKCQKFQALLSCVYFGMSKTIISDFLS